MQRLIFIFFPKDVLLMKKYFFTISYNNLRELQQELPYYKMAASLFSSSYLQRSAGTTEA